MNRSRQSYSGKHQGPRILDVVAEATGIQPTATSLNVKSVARVVTLLWIAGIGLIMTSNHISLIYLHWMPILAQPLILIGILTLWSHGSHYSRSQHTCNQGPLLGNQQIHIGGGIGLKIKQIGLSSF